jgi:coenzyme F420-0:L-glutamate ligase / coenzyme F420-1:gamma-L-glutamate ligase
MASLRVIAIEGLPMIRRGDDLARLIADALSSMGLQLQQGDILTVCQKIVSKAEGRLVSLKEVLIVETGPGWVCANAGIDQSNSLSDDVAILLPEDADASAARIRDELQRITGAAVAVLITDTFGRPWRDGLTEVCLGIAGMDPLLDMRGTTDLGGRELHHTVIAVADELAAAAGLMMPKAGAVPAVLIRGYQFKPTEASAKSLIRPAASDLFR